jgi:hypothetical protein
LNGGNNHQRSDSDFVKLFRDMFHRPTKHKILQTEKELNTLSKTLIKSDETTETLASISHNQDTCLFSESPHYIVRV